MHTSSTPKSLELKLELILELILNIKLKNILFQLDRKNL